jgi:hypothetical protein
LFLGFHSSASSLNHGARTLKFYVSKEDELEKEREKRPKKKIMQNLI